MCGIAGYFGFDQAVANRVAAMMHAQVHRGPDAYGRTIDRIGNAFLALGHRRLSVIDTSPAGNQPMRHPETGDVIVFNGEIYNFPELRRELKSMGARFRSASDTEVVLHAFAQWGTDCFSRLHGMFALAIYQPSHQRLVLARDPLGIKPLYYALTPRAFTFSSELRALMFSGLLAFEIDHRGLAGFLAYGAVQEPFTLIHEALMLPAGTWAALELSAALPATLEFQCHWRFPTPSRYADRDETVARVRAVLENAVRRHLLSDVPVAVFLSSGLDSSAVAALAAESEPAVQTFTISLRDKRLDEAPVAEETARTLETRHKTVLLEEDEVLLHVHGYFDALDQPTIDGLNTYLIAAAVRARGIKVALSGLGGDELFGGYPSLGKLIDWLPWARRLSRLPHAFRRKVVPHSLRILPIPQRYKAIDMVLCEPNIANLGIQRRRLFSNTELSRFDIQWDGLGLTDDFQVPDFHPRPEWFDNDPTAAMSVIESVGYMRNMLLRDADVFGMAHGLEIRVPFLDRDLIDYVFTLPGNLRTPRNGVNKPLLVDALGDRLPPKLSRLPKRGFSLMQHEWLRGPLKDFCEQALGLAAETLGEAPVSALWRAFIEKGNDRLWSRIWACATLGTWVKKLSGDLCNTNQPTVLR